MRLTEEQEELVLNNRNLVHSRLKQLGIHPGDRDYEDMVSIGTIGLCKSARYFDPTKAKFSTFAYKYITTEIFMYFRKNKKENSLLSLHSIYENPEGNKLTLLSTFSNSAVPDFEKQITYVYTIEKALSYIMHCLSSKNRTIMLFAIAGLKQLEIANIVSLSRERISKIEKKFYDKIKNCENEKYKEVFNVKLENDQFIISFSTTSVEHFNEILANFLINNGKKDLQTFGINRTKNRVEIFLPAEKDSFILLAKLLQEIDNYKMSCKEEIKQKTVETVDDSPVLDFVGATEIKEYFLSLDTFTIEDIMKKFPNVKPSTIYRALNSAKEAEQIFSISRGIYST